MQKRVFVFDINRVQKWVFVFNRTVCKRVFVFNRTVCKNGYSYLIGPCAKMGIRI